MSEESRLFSETLRLLRADKRTLEEIAHQSGLPYHWLAKIKRGATLKPDVNRIQPLYEFLSGKTLMPDSPNA